MPIQITSSDETYRKKIQNQILGIIENKLTKKEMKADRAQTLAQYVLSCFQKGNTRNQIYTAIKNFDLKKFPELFSIPFLAIKEKIEEQMKKIADKLAILLKNKKFDEASKLLQNIRISK
jgi:hypothetical protein